MHYSVNKKDWYNWSSKEAMKKLETVVTHLNYRPLSTDAKTKDFARLTSYPVRG